MHTDVSVVVGMAVVGFKVVGGVVRNVGAGVGKSVVLFEGVAVRRIIGRLVGSLVGIFV